MDRLSNQYSFKARLSAYLPVFFLLFVLAFLQYDTNLWVNFSGDTAKFLGIEWHMFHSGNYLVPYSNGHIYIDKPPLLFWLTVLGWKVFGINTFWPQLMVLFFVASWLPLLVRIYNKLYGCSHFSIYEMPWILGGSVIVLRAIDMYRVDIILTTSILLFINIYLTHFDNYSKKNIVKKSFQYIAVFTIGYYAKGPVILIFTLLPVMILCCIRRRFSSLFPVIIGATIALLFFLPWVFYIYNRSELAGHALVSQVANRSRGFHFHLFSYLGAVLYTTLPWVFVIFSNTRKNIKLITSGVRSSHLLVFLSIVIPIIFFSFWGGKMGNRYIMPSLLLFLVVLSRLLDDTGNIFNKVKYMGVVMLSMLVVLFLVLSRMPHIYIRLLHSHHVFLPSVFNLSYLILIVLPISYFFFCSRKGVFSIRIFAAHFFIFFIVATFFAANAISNISNFDHFFASVKKSEHPVLLFKQTIEGTNFLSLILESDKTLSNFNDKDSLLLDIKKSQRPVLYVTNTNCLKKDKKVSYYLRKHTNYNLCSS